MPPATLIAAIILVAIVSAIAAQVAGRFRSAWAWGFLFGPLGIVVAALLGIRESLDARPIAQPVRAPESPAAAPPPAARDLPPSTIARPCRQCGESARRPATEWAETVRCANCGQVVPL